MMLHTPVQQIYTIYASVLLFCKTYSENISLIICMFISCRNPEMILKELLSNLQHGNHNHTFTKNAYYVQDVILESILHTCSCY